jgi:glutaminyl-tRNA synthetase
VRNYNNLLTVEDQSSDERDFHELLNPESEVILPEAYVEPFVQTVAEKGAKFQFQRIGYYCVDEDSTPEHLVFNRTTLLRDSK